MAQESSYFWLEKTEFTIGEPAKLILKEKVVQSYDRVVAWLSGSGGKSYTIFDGTYSGDMATTFGNTDVEQLRALLEKNETMRKNIYLHLRLYKGGVQKSNMYCATITMHIDDYAASLASEISGYAYAIGVSPNPEKFTNEYPCDMCGMGYSFSGQLSGFNCNIASVKHTWLAENRKSPALTSEDSYETDDQFISGSAEIAVFPTVTADAKYRLVSEFTDTRGITATTYYPSADGWFTVLPYTKPQFTTLTLGRCKEDGALDAVGFYANLTTEWEFSALADADGNARNSITVKTVKKRLKGETVWGDAVELTSGANVLPDFDIDNSYELFATLTDEMTSTSQILTLPTASCAFMLRAGGKGVSFGTAETADNLLRVAWDAKIDGDLTVLGAISSGKSESVTYTWQNTAVAAEENIFDITLPDYMNEDGGECDVIMQFKYGDSITTTNRSGYMSIWLDNDTGKSYIGGICITGNSTKYTGRRISLGFCNSSDGFNTYHFTIRNMFGSLYLEGTSTSLYGSDKTQITSRYVIQHTNTATTHSIQIYPSVAVVDTGSATITIRKGR